VALVAGRNPTLFPATSFAFARPVRSSGEFSGSTPKRFGPPPKQDGGAAGGDDYNAAFEMRTTAGPSSVEQCVLSGGPYTV